MSVLLKNTVPPSAREKQIASESSQVLDPVVSASHEVQIQLLGEDVSQPVLSLPAPAVRLLNEILKEMARGHAVTLLPGDVLLTTQEAADILNVSRPFLIDLLEKGKIPYQRLGSHRRIVSGDLLAFKSKAEAAREEALRLLTEEAQALDMGY